jgi:hypothetical protein
MGCISVKVWSAPGVPPLPPLQPASPTPQGACAGFPTAVASAARWPTCEKRISFLSFPYSLCLSRACLGKMIIFIMKRLNKRRFSRLIEDHVRALPCAEEERGAVAKGHDGRVHRHRRDVPVCILQYNGASNILRGKVRALDHVALPPKHHIVIVTTLLADRFRCGERYYTSRRRSHQCAPSLE